MPLHISQTTAPSAKVAAEFYHGHCVRILIEMKDEEDGEVHTQGLALASVCLLRSYEILSGTPGYVQGSSVTKPRSKRSSVVSWRASDPPGGRSNDSSQTCKLRGVDPLQQLSKKTTNHNQFNSIWNDLGKLLGARWTGSEEKHIPSSDLEGTMRTIAQTSNLLFRQQAAFSLSCARRGLASLTRQPQPAHPFIVRPSDVEVRNKLLGPRNLELAVRHLHADGLVVIEDVVPHKDLDALNEKMTKDARYLQSLGDKGPFNYNQGNLQQDPPPVAEYFYKSIFTNPIATQITSTVLGPRPKWTFCSANSAMPPLLGASPQRQPVHSDADFDNPSHPFALVINIPLVTMTPENGSTELWLGTHTADVSAQEGKHGDRASGRIKESLLADRRGVRGPSQPDVRKGSIVLRDLRLWHAGMPNMSEEVRVMLAMIHFAPWYRNPMRLQLGEDVSGLLAGLESQLEIPVDWVKNEKVLGSYLQREFGNSYDFGQEK
ncbi:hypothetical protein N8I77_001448 [Diaporthe amygdali]|uniref:Uncharacterized protein n=1 Tax=Phomopsis amygdali TaxID=1214568 RepID=A0AAD9W873_PHOAM|nr:hypothetical protein N8I77_001448 [Diaporthe amygdali]